MPHVRPLKGGPLIESVLGRPGVRKSGVVQETTSQRVGQDRGFDQPEGRGMRGTCWSLVLLAVFALVPAQNTTAKLQNVSVNGTCFMPSEERMAEAAFIPCGNSEMQFPVIRLATSEQANWSKRTACARLESVIIPPMPQSERYGE